MKILGIETSCDETAAAIVEGRGGKAKVLSNVVASQIDIHKKYGGVVPEVAAREHVLNILPVINEALITARISADLKLIHAEKKKSASIRAESASVCDIDAIAVTVGPGLITSLQVGVETAKTLAYAWKVPVVAVNHIESHLYSNFIEREKIGFPALILTVSGGHTILVLMKDHGRLQVIGETRDDAAGEAFDKAASLLGLGYPGGPTIAREAERWKSQITNSPANGTPLRGGKTQTNSKSQILPRTAPRYAVAKYKQIQLPRPMLESDNFEFSFSGLKTALLYQIKKDKDWKKRVPEYSAEFQQAVVDVLVGKTVKAARKFGVSTVMLAGGVAANRALRAELEQAVKNSGLNFMMPEMKYTTDNAAMIAAAGYFMARRKKFTLWQKLKADSNLELK